MFTVKSLRLERVFDHATGRGRRPSGDTEKISQIYSIYPPKKIECICRESGGVAVYPGGVRLCVPSMYLCYRADLLLNEWGLARLARVGSGAIDKLRRSLYNSTTHPRWEPEKAWLKTQPPCDRARLKAAQIKFWWREGISLYLP